MMIISQEIIWKSDAMANNSLYGIDLDKSGHYLTFLDFYGQNWTLFDKTGQKSLDRTGHYWTLLDIIGHY